MRRVFDRWPLFDSRDRGVCCRWPLFESRYRGVCCRWQLIAPAHLLRVFETWPLFEAHTVEPFGKWASGAWLRSDSRRTRSVTQGGTAA